ncbi:glycosyltransferase family 1 protein [Niallia circulans]|uniref:Glycosyltransferase family 1 protein n=1 Tax=Niallia circulans TaxID=1397 RepID=A0A553SMM9_NIACI|nr:glycosyltransferase family 4 protein [Niallia circulans]TRZ38254.1 glycosyltransferase family 1 protein [Niallia circulans]
MKILLATYWIVPHVGGVWNYMNQLKKRLEAMGHEVDLLGYGEMHKYTYFVSEEKKIYNDDLLEEINNRLAEKQSIPYMADPVVTYCEKHRIGYELAISSLNLQMYDIIHTQDVFSTTSFGNLKLSGPRLIATLHGSVAHEMKDHLLYEHVTATSQIGCTYFDELEHTGATSAEVTIVANNWLKNILIDEFHVPEEQLTVLHYGFDIDSFLSRIDERDSNIYKPTDKQIILFTGRLVALKGVHILIEALKQLRGSIGNWQCWIVGEGEKLTELKLQAEKAGLEDYVFFFGSRDDIPQLLSKADIYVLPSMIENQPLSVIEAQIVGRAVIVSDAGGLPEMVVHGTTGLIVSKGNVDELRNSLYMLLVNKEYQSFLGKNAKDWGVKHWSLEVGVDNLLGIYDKGKS